MNVMDDHEQKKIFLASLALAAALMGLLAFIAAARITLPPCLFFRLTGLYCPGCGGTRAWIALLHGHPLRSLVYHPVVLYGTAVYGIYLLRNLLALFFGKDHRKDHPLLRGMAFRDLYLYVAVGIILVNWITKNILLVAFHLAL